MANVLKTCALFLSLTCISCGLRTELPEDQPNTEFAQSEHQLEELTPDNFEFIEIEGCEYVVFRHVSGTHGYGFMAHKGNCDNPIHCRRDE